MQLERPLFLTSKILLVDGIVRTGKSMLGPILGSFEGVEIERIEPILEKIPFLYHFKKIDEDAAMSLIRTEVEMRLYDSMISRHANLRRTDHTGIFSNVKTLMYLKRLFMKEGDCVVERIKSQKPFFQVQQHDILGFCELYYKAFGDKLRIFEMVRHPVDLIEDQYRRGYGKREGSDPRVWVFTIKYKDKVLPWYADGWEDEYLSINRVERLIRSIEVKTNRVFGLYNSLTSEQKSQVMFIPFEKFVVDPWSYVKKMEKFIARKSTHYTPKSLKQQRCPRILDHTIRKKHYNFLVREASPKYVKILDRISKDYDEMVSKL